MTVNLTATEIEVLWKAAGRDRQEVHPDKLTAELCLCSWCTAFRKLDKGMRQVIRNRAI